MADLGVHPNTYWAGGMDGYVRRDIDIDLAAALAYSGHVVVVHGAQLAGCSRTLGQALFTTLPKQWALLLKPDPEIDWEEVLKLAGGWAARGHGAVLWLDAATVQGLEGLAASIGSQNIPDGLWIVVSAHSDLISSSSLPVRV